MPGRRSATTHLVSGEIPETAPERRPRPLFFLETYLGVKGRSRERSNTSWIHEKLGKEDVDARVKPETTMERAPLFENRIYPAPALARVLVSRKACGATPVCLRKKRAKCDGSANARS